MMAVELQQQSPPRTGTASSAALRRKAVSGTPWMGLGFSLLGMAVALALSIDLVFRLRFLEDDAVSRVANASYVLFSRDLHLSAIGFVWPPLPSLLEIPVLLLSPWFPPLLTDGYAANLWTVVGFGGAIWAFDRTMRRFQVPAVWRFLSLAAFALNPILVFYAANGMSEGFFLPCMAFMMDAYVNYLQEDHWAPLGLTGFWLAMAFLVRYEAVLIGVGIAIGVVWRHVAAKRSQVQLESSLYFVLAPPVYTGVLWMVIQWMIMGSPFFFATTHYGNAASVGTGIFFHGLIGASRHHLPLSLLFAFAHLLLSPAWIPLALWSYIQRKALTGRIISIVPMFVFLLQVLLLDIGQSAGGARYFFYIIPTTFWLAAAIMGANRRHWVQAGISLLLIASAAISGWVDAETWIGAGDSYYLQRIITQTPVNTKGEWEQIARFLDTVPLPNGPILADSYNAWGIIINTSPMARFATTSDLNFRSLMAAPWGRVSYILVPTPAHGGYLDAANRDYPGLYAYGASWATLVRHWPGWKLYRVATSPHPSASGLGREAVYPGKGRVTDYHGNSKGHSVHGSPGSAG